MSDNFEPNPTRYLECSQPLPSKEAAAETMQAFLDAVEALRVQHKIADVAIAIRDSYLTEAGDVTTFMTRGFWGDALCEEVLLAWAFGQAQSARQERVYDLIRASNSFTNRRGR